MQMGRINVLTLGLAKKLTLRVSRGSVTLSSYT